MGYYSSQEENYLHLDIPSIFQAGPKRRNAPQLGDSEPGQESGYNMYHPGIIRPPTRTEDLDTPRIDDGSLPRENASSYESWAANAEWEERSPGRHTSVSEMEAQQEQAEAASVSAQDFGRGVEVGNPVWNENEGVGTQESVDLSGCQD
ncbi:hypothetical protein C2857_004596 [Epichloe festucae Fl1]|uniref:Uncharacterized protein n=1 Tax=Epichloe festucae (strain Fl1) TaxID=877507 RepID=A0A7U3SPC5_EPIFF|nr:hypothetical protein C2857_004596 [Epichloe festucae Fl1]